MTVILVSDVFVLVSGWVFLIPLIKTDMVCWVCLNSLYHCKVVRLKLYKSAG